MLIQQAENPRVDNVHTVMKQTICISRTRTDHYSCLGELSDCILNPVSAKSISSTSIHEVQIQTLKHVIPRIPCLIEKLSVTQMVNPLALEMNIQIVAFIYIKCDYFTNQKSVVMKYTTFCRGIN